uniref:Sugar phosphate transporter domain-containing protein n=1 Tax=Ananas comosus var. bracteatus TaxID=296719 RepID=A0A6V7QUH9_ANACO
MISCAKHSAASLGVADLFRFKSPPPQPQIVAARSVFALRNPSLALSSSKPLYLAFPDGLGCGLRDASLSRVKPRRRSFRCEAYEADRSGDAEATPTPTRSAAAQKLKIGTYFATWWALNVVFNIYNKKDCRAPKTDFDFWKALAPVAVAHTIGHVAATVSMSKVAVSFTHIIKSGEPAFSVLVSRFLLGETFPVPVYLSLIPIIGGCALAAVTELNFNMIGFMGAMISNVAFVFRNIFSKRGMKGKSVSGMNYYACLSILSLLLLTPFAIAIEGPQVWAAGWQKALSEIGPHFVWWVAAQSVFYHLYNQVSYMSLDEISPLTFSIGNTMKRISVIVSSIIIFHTPVQPINALGLPLPSSELFSTLRQSSNLKQIQMILQQDECSEALERRILLLL